MQLVATAIRASNQKLIGINSTPSVMDVFQILAPSESDPTFHGAVHTATLAVCTVLVTFVVVLGTFGNGLVLLSAVQWRRRRRSSVDVLVLNLAGSDLVMCSCLSPTFLYLLFSNRPSTREFCGGLLFLSASCGILSLLTLVAIAVYRGSRIRGKLKGTLSSTRIGGILAGIYAISLGTAVGGTLHVTLGWSESYTTCQAVMNSHRIGSNNVVLFFISPVVVAGFLAIVVCYCLIARAVKFQTFLRVQALQPLLSPTSYAPIQTTAPQCRDSASSPFVQSAFLNPSSTAQLPRKNTTPLKHCSCCSCMTALDKENKATSMCFVVILIVSLCWTPLVISHLIEILTGESIVLYQVKLCGIALVCLNSALNPYIYAQNRGGVQKPWARFLWDILRCQCQFPHRRQLRTFNPHRSLSRMLANSVLIPDCATFHLWPEKPGRACKMAEANLSLFSACPKKIKDSAVQQSGGVSGQSPGQMSAERDLKQVVQNLGQTHLGEQSRGANVRILVHPTCCNGTLTDDVSLLES